MTFFRNICYCLLVFITFGVKAQVADSTDVSANNSIPVDSFAKLKVQSIIIRGNLKTKTYIILREIQFKPGDSIFTLQLNNELEKARQQIYNTTLFGEVKVEIIPVAAFEINVVVKVKEKLFFYPLPQFQLIDRNYNEWLVTHKGDLSRVNYGVKLVHYNLNGRRDILRLYLINGATRSVSFSYSAPYSNSALTNGFSFGAGISQNKEFNYATSYNNKQAVYYSDDFPKKNWTISAGYFIRKEIKNKHQFLITYTNIEVPHSLPALKINGQDTTHYTYYPNYFGDSSSKKGFVDLVYTFSHIDVDNVAYPLKGITGSLILSKRGLQFTGDVNAFTLEGNYAKYWSHRKNWYSSIQLSGRVKLPLDQPFINQQALGYGENYLRSLEYYVIDGSAFGILKGTLKKKLISFSIPVPFKFKLVSKIPFTLYAKAYSDAGFAYNKKQYETFLNNKLLYTGGFGLDILTLWDICIKFEYGFNQLNQKGLFLHAQGGFR